MKIVLFSLPLFPVNQIHSLTSYDSARSSPENTINIHQNSYDVPAFVPHCSDRNYKEFFFCSNTMKLSNSPTDIYRSGVANNIRSFCLRIWRPVTVSEFWKKIDFQAVEIYSELVAFNPSPPWPFSYTRINLIYVL